MSKETLSYKRKSQIVYEYLHKYAIDTFVETGTYKGAGVANALTLAKEVYSIEIDRQRYENAVNIFKGFSNVHLYHGDSGKILLEIMPEFKGRCLFWLDAHYGDDESPGQRRTPIIEELKTVCNYSGYFVILIDDARLYTGEGDWPKLETLGNIIKSALPDCKFIVNEDIIRIIPRNAEPVNERRFVSMSTLGKYGRFGNQIFQYAALRTYAGMRGLRTEIPRDWIGRKIFPACNDLPISDAPRTKRMTGNDCIWLNGEVLDGSDIQGYFQYHTKNYNRELFKALFTFFPQIEQELLKPLILLKQIGDIVGVHIRLADYKMTGRSGNIAPTKWYLEWLDKNWSRLKNPVLFLASDEIDEVLHDFERYNPCHYNRETDDLYDFYTLAHCDYLLISNSTFSFTASMFNDTAREFYRPDFNNSKLVSFDPWNAEPLLKP